MSKPQVVIVRKDKRVRHKFLHLVAFAVTGGASSIVTAAEVANHASYNARTARLQAPANVNTRRAMRRLAKQNVEEFDGGAAAFRSQHVPTSREYRESH